MKISTCIQQLCLGLRTITQASIDKSVFTWTGVHFNYSSKHSILSTAKRNVCVKYATFLHLGHIISIKVVVLALKCITYSIFYNIWLNERRFVSKVLLPFVYRRIVDTKSRDYSNSVRFSSAFTRGCFLAPSASYVYDGHKCHNIVAQYQIFFSVHTIF